MADVAALLNDNLQLSFVLIHLFAVSEASERVQSHIIHFCTHAHAPSLLQCHTIQLARELFCLLRHQPLANQQAL